MGESRETHAGKDWILKPKRDRSLSVVFALLVVLSLVCSTLLNRRLTLDQRQKIVAADRDGESAASFRWNPTLFKILSFGHVPAAVDWLLIRFLTDSNIQKMKNDEGTEAFRILDLATEIDPAFYSLYTAGSGFLSVVRDDRRGALKLIKKGHRFLNDVYPTLPEAFRARYWANAWRIEFIRGYIYMLDFQDMGKAAAAYSEMIKYSDAPDGVKAMAESLKSPARQFVLGLNSLEIFKKWAGEDSHTLGELEKKRQMLLLSQSIYLLNEEFSKFRTGDTSDARWEAFRAQKGLSTQDPFGGKFYLNSNGRITTTTPRVPVLGINVE